MPLRQGESARLQWLSTNARRESERNELVNVSCRITFERTVTNGVQIKSNTAIHMRILSILMVMLLRPHQSILTLPITNRDIIRRQVSSRHLQAQCHSNTPDNLPSLLLVLPTQANIRRHLQVRPQHPATRITHLVQTHMHHTEELTNK